MTNEELVHLVTRAYDAGFRSAYYETWEDTGYLEEILVRGDYLGERDDWVRAHVTEGDTWLR